MGVASDQLPKMALVERARGAQSGHTGNQETMQQRTSSKDDRTGTDGTDKRAGIRPEEGEPTTAGHQHEAGEHSQHQEFALGKIDDPHDAEDQAEADTHQPVDATDGQTGGNGIQYVLDKDFEIHARFRP